MEEFYFLCSYCKARVEAEISNAAILDLGECPQCKRNSLEIHSPYHFGAKFNAPIFVKQLLKDVPMIALLDTNEIFEYVADTGAYRQETVINQELNSRLGVLFQKRYADECRAVVLGTAAIDRAELNANADLINCKNGVYDTEAGVLLPHDAKYHFTYCLPFAYEPTAQCDKFERFLADVCSGDLRMITSILEGFAYTFIPGYPIQRANMLVGIGANGKGTLLNVLKAFVGPDNCEHLTLQTMTKETSFALARLQGKLLNIGPDLPAEGLHDAGNFKALTGGDTLSADVKYIQNAVKLSNSAKLWFSANTIPKSPEDTDAYYRRWNIWRFSKTYPEGQNVLPELTTESELSGIFNMVLEILPVLKKSLRYTFACDAETSRKDYLKSADTVQLFADECLDYDPECNVPKFDLYLGYMGFCKTNTLIPVKDNAFWRSLSKKVTYRENTPVRDGPRFAKGQRFALPQDSEKVDKMTPEQVLEKVKEVYDNSGNSRISRLFPYCYILSQLSTPQETIRLNPAEPAEPVAEIPQTSLISNTSLEKGPDTPIPQTVSTPSAQHGSDQDTIIAYLSQQDGQRADFAKLADTFPQILNLHTMLEGMERGGYLFRPRAGIWELVKREEIE